MKAAKALEAVKIKPDIRSPLTPEENTFPSWVMPAVKGGIIATDALLAIGCFLTAFWLRNGTPILSKTAWAWSKEFVPYVGVLFFLLTVRVLMFAYRGTYRFSGAFSYTAELSKVFKAVSVASLLTVAFTFLFRTGYQFRDFPYSRGVFILDFAIALVVFSCFHLGVRYFQTLIRRRDINLIPTLVVGKNVEARQTILELKKRQDLGYKVVGVIHSDGSPDVGGAFSDVPVVGSLRDLSGVIRELAIQEVIITDTDIPNDTLFEVMMECDSKKRVEFRLAPALINFLPQKTSVDQIGILPMVRLFREPLSDFERFTKRLFDIAISTIALVLLSPLLFLFAFLIKIDSKGKVLFRQERVGMDGRKFLCYKFRTMFADSDESIHREVYRKNIRGEREANVGNIEKPVFGKVKNDFRVTGVGRILRRMSLDELPQLLNVLSGDMSIAGPRPPIPYEVEEYETSQRKRLDMKPGITGLWQVSGRNRLTFEEMVRIDLFYIENWSIWLDLKIILLTLPAMLRGDGAK